MNARMHANITPPPFRSNLLLLPPSAFLPIISSILSIFLYPTPPPSFIPLGPPLSLPPVQGLGGLRIIGEIQFQDRLLYELKLKVSCTLMMDL